MWIYNFESIYLNGGLCHKDDVKQTTFIDYWRQTGGGQTRFRLPTGRDDVFSGGRGLCWAVCAGSEVGWLKCESTAVFQCGFGNKRS